MAAQFVLYAFFIPAQLAGFASLVLFQTRSAPPRLPKFQQKRTKQRCFNPCLLDQLQVQDQLLSAVFTGELKTAMSSQRGEALLTWRTSSSPLQLCLRGGARAGGRAGGAPKSVVIKAPHSRYGGYDPQRRFTGRGFKAGNDSVG